MHRDSDHPHTPTAIYGIDFSGALDAGRKIWISLAMIKDDALEIRDCFQGFSLPNSGRRLHDCLAALVTFIASHRNSLFGIDFPFGIPHDIVEKIGVDRWIEFIAVFMFHGEGPLVSGQGGLGFVVARKLNGLD